MQAKDLKAWMRKHDVALVDMHISGDKFHVVFAPCGKLHKIAGEGNANTIDEALAAAVVSVELHAGAKALGTGGAS